jgi:hypothetical protein
MKAIRLSISQGNRCGHDPRRPKIGPGWPGPNDESSGPYLTYELAARWFHQPLASPICRGPGRQTRSERREACLTVLSVILKHLDSHNLRVGLPTAGDGFIGLGVKTIARESGLGMRRCERTIAWLKAAGLIASAEPVRPCPGPKRASSRVVLLVNSDFLKKLIQEQERPGQNQMASEADSQP